MKALPRNRYERDVAIGIAFGEGDTAPCHYCGALLKRKQATVDHVEPLLWGGRDRRENMVVSCRGCNSQKGSSR